MENTPLKNEYVVSLGTLDGGSVPELFDIELAKVLENIMDPNTHPKVAREIGLKVTFLPSDDRSMANVIVDCRAKLAPHRGAETSVWFGKMNNKRVAVGSNPRQGLLFEKPEDPSKVVHFPAKEESGSGE